jgi:hypothetical protein
MMTPTTAAASTAKPRTFTTLDPPSDVGDSDAPLERYRVTAAKRIKPATRLA